VLAAFSHVASYVDLIDVYVPYARRPRAIVSEADVARELAGEQPRRSSIFTRSRA
jgi:hypothetical protein